MSNKEGTLGYLHKQCGCFDGAVALDCGGDSVFTQSVSRSESVAVNKLFDTLAIEGVARLVDTDTKCPMCEQPNLRYAVRVGLR